MKTLLSLYRVKRFIIAFFILMVLIITTIINLAPIYYMISTSFKTQNEYIINIMGLPKEFTSENYQEIFFNFNFGRVFLNSLILTFASVFIGIYLSALASFAFGKMRFKGKNVFINMIIPLMAIPVIIMFLPLYLIMTKLHLVNTFFAPIMIYVGIIIPFTVYLLTSFMDSIPNELLESARIDGCSNIRIFHKIVIPLIAPAISTSVIVNGMWVWNELLIAFIFFQGEKNKTLIVKLATFQGLYNLNIPLIMAGATLVSLPIIILYIVSQKWFIRGLVEGSIK